MDIDKTIQACQDENAQVSYEELMELKRWLFEEYTKIQAKEAEQQRIYEKFISERTAFNEDMKALNSKILEERKRLKDEEAFFDKRMKILQNGFMSLDLDRKKLERERREFELNKRRRSERSANSSGSSRKTSGAFNYNAEEVSVFFKGVSGPLALRKRYKDLLKIFHPDNYGGDENIVKAINEEFNRLRKEDIS